MNIKKLFVVASLAVMTVSVCAQDFKKFRWGPTAGLNIASISSDETSSRVGFSVGAIGEYNFSDNLFMTGTLKFSQKGFKSGDYFKANPGYLEIPIHGGYRYSINEQFTVFGEFGPYFAFGVCGKAKGIDYSTDYFGDGTKRFDFGLGFAVGAEFSKFQLRLGYDLGLTKLSNGDGAPKNRNFNISISYMF